MKAQRQVASVAGALALLLVATVAFVPASAQDTKVNPAITVAQLAGPWQIAVVGNTGCGQTSLLFTGTLNAGGQSTGTLIGSSGCGPSDNTQTFTINSLNADGSGTAGLSCGDDCGWNFTIQVSPNKQVINLVDVTDGDGNYLAGTAVKQ
jgi:hypothetical protein